MSDNIEYGRPIWQHHRSQGKSYLQKIIQDMAELEAKRSECDIIMEEAEGGLFIPRYVGEKLEEHEIKALFEAGKIGPNEARRMAGLTDKYNLNKRVLIL